MLPIVPLRDTADRLMFSALVWFSQSGSGADIKPITAAFLDVEDAIAWGKAHPGQTVHFPGGGQLQARYALIDGDDHFRRRVPAVAALAA